MSNFTRVRATGMWTVSVLLASELEKFDANLFKAPNFADGGTYAPSSVITIGGAGLTLTTTLNGAVAVFGGNVTLGTNSGQTITVNGIMNASTINVGGYLSCNGGGYFGGVGETYAFEGNINAVNDVTLGSTSADALQVNAASTFAAAASFNGGVQITNSALECSIDPRLALSFGVVALTGDISISSTSGASIAGYTCGVANRNVTLEYSGFSSGTIKMFKNLDASLNVVVRDQYTSATLATLTPGMAGIFIFRSSVTGWFKLLAV